MNGSVDQALRDMAAEGDFLQAVVAEHSADLDLPTPSPGWTIRDQIGHLMWTDRMVITAITDSVAFAAIADSFANDPTEYVNAGTQQTSTMHWPELADAWQASRAHLLQLLEQLPAGVRINWLGPSMGVGTMAAARIMETWAHGVDITDTVGLAPNASGRLWNVADLGVRTRAFAFGLHSEEPPDPPRVELLAPGGHTWQWGPVDATERLDGTALDFCLLVTSAGTGPISASSVVAQVNRWLDIAQAFAGPAGDGRAPTG